MTIMSKTDSKICNQDQVERKKTEKSYHNWAGACLTTWFLSSLTVSIHIIHVDWCNYIIDGTHKKLIDNCTNLITMKDSDFLSLCKLFDTSIPSELFTILVIFQYKNSHQISTLFGLPLALA